MAYTTGKIAPSNSKTHITPYTQRVLLNNADYFPKVFLSHVTNKLLQTFTLGNNDKIYSEDAQLLNSLGEFESSEMIAQQSYTDRIDCILDGMKNTFTLDSTSSVGEYYFVVDVNPGVLIADTTLIVFPQTTQLAIDLSDLGNIDECGNIILSLQYQWIDTLDPNEPYLCLDYQTYGDSSEIQPNEWEVSRNRIVLNVFQWNRTGMDKEDIDESSFVSLMPNPFNFDRNLFITVKELDYQIAPVSAMFYEYKSIMQNTYIKNITKNITSSDWNTAIPPFTTVPHIYKSIDISSLRATNIPTVQCYVDNFIISPTGVNINTDDKTITIWMPESFIDELKDLNVTIMG